MTPAWRRGSVAAWLMAALALGVTAATLRHNTWTAGGADASGYVSQADRWVERQLTVPLPLAHDAPWPDSEMAFAPLGYRPAITPGAMVPTYPAGLPLTLAIARVLGGRHAVYVVVPLLAGLGVWLTWVLGRRLGGDVVGVVAAMLMAVCPIWLRQSTQVMSDVPAATWWTLALVLAHSRSRGAAVGAGLSTSIAILTRPNLAPVVLAIAGAMVASRERVRQAGTPGATALPAAFLTRHRDTAGRLALFALSVIPGCALVAWVHTHLYGSPLRSGYGSNADLYALANVAQNARLYSTWLVDGQTPMLLLALGAGLLRQKQWLPGLYRGLPGRGWWLARAPDQTDTAQTQDLLDRGPGPDTGLDNRRRPIWPLWLLIVLVVSMYLPYAVFEDWWYIRFLTPAFPAALVLVSMTVVGVAARFPRSLGAVVLVAATSILLVLSVARAQAHHVFDLKRDERRYALVADALSAATPATSAFICMQHGGSARHYLNRTVLRWDQIPPDRLNNVVEYLRQQRLRPYILLDSWEAPRFRERFASSSAYGQLDWPPILELRTPTPVRLFDPDDRARYFAGQRIPTRLIFPPRP